MFCFKKYSEKMIKVLESKKNNVFGADIEWKEVYNISISNFEDFWSKAEPDFDFGSIDEVIYAKMVFFQIKVMAIRFWRLRNYLLHRSARE